MFRLFRSEPTLLILAGFMLGSAAIGLTQIVSQDGTAQAAEVSR
jgi:hypothetical protein